MCFLTRSFGLEFIFADFKIFCYYIAALLVLFVNMPFWKGRNIVPKNFRADHHKHILDPYQSNVLVRAVSLMPYPRPYKSNQCLK